MCLCFACLPSSVARQQQEERECQAALEESARLGKAVELQKEEEARIQALLDQSEASLSALLSEAQGAEADLDRSRAAFESANKAHEEAKLHLAHSVGHRDQSAKQFSEKEARLKSQDDALLRSIHDTEAMIACGKQEVANIVSSFFSFTVLRVRMSLRSSI